MEYHQQLPDELEIDHIIDFLNELQVEQERAWRTIKIYVATFRWFYEHILQAKEFTSLIPYPREKPSLPQILNREELARLFNNCPNKKHRAMFRLLYSSGLRRNGLLYLKIADIITSDSTAYASTKARVAKTATPCLPKMSCWSSAISRPTNRRATCLTAGSQGSG